ncbi:cytochrome c1 [Candidatus Bandiella euplotis]|uniref:Cytochrome c1 n=1 Tax=Candidatus Bandiella euplotis TaxID=1664265 RepID=A0ABZ0UMF8_9RICK|nr:cytochrome c1 [Candidatus Bandiella woodruffii]WPX96904.1 Cytochrome c1 [Candidatus Bandiella woodruffii]
MKKILALLFVCLIALIVHQAHSSDEANPPKKMQWSFSGVTGKFDRQSIQRGFKVYKEVCSACHSVKRIAFRNLSEIGFNEDEIKSLASEYTVKDGPNDEGEMFDRPATPSDYIPGPYANEKAARASNNGAYPPDLSLITKARPDGENYVYSLLTGYTTPPSGFNLGENMYYNPYFIAGGDQLAMPPPLTTEGQVEYDDGTKSTIDAMAKDVTNFLQWTAEPEMEESKSLGIKVLIFLSIFTVLFYIAMKRIWKKVK